jgi:hypothetical protein
MAKGVNKGTDEEALLAEANRINYRLRSTFFYRKLKEYETLSFPSLVERLIAHSDIYSWDDRDQWGIGEDAFSYIKDRSEIHLFHAFCHPRLLREHQRLLPYYRNVAALSQKSVGYLLKGSPERIRIDIKKFGHGSGQGNRRAGQ